ncbi:Type 1 glutamine amidotransferase-like domain-containing protein [Rhodococcus sp. I2R]|uniref:Type 1 glutamine amidotransferase-like domain-containing protein n=1 Tax=Rhodococcus sp. I2R TaxID=2855445 RepID=UPI001E2F2607|nr:Type 1 glutamine amidotransferase-like domain-containing protein [Rhodococcus sp. I2R]MCC8929882.1 peptidase E [Rhodococcus sp. I2R]
MKLFLASYRFGVHVARFVALTRDRPRVAVIANAADAWPAAARDSALASEMTGLRRLGLDPFELDLRQFRGRPDELATELDSAGTLWVRGGNTFVLRSQLARCGAEDPIVSRVRDGDLVFAGYSAGACVASPTLRGVETADDPADVEAVGGDVVWSGLGLIDTAVVPHYGSILDDTDAARSMVARFEREQIDHLTLTDEQVIVVDGDRFERI